MGLPDHLRNRTERMVYGWATYAGDPLGVASSLSLHELDISRQIAIGHQCGIAVRSDDGGDEFTSLVARRIERSMGGEVP
ncbi:hypothetical protein [Xylophilus sp. GOD-11R]|uniref:hypothetical protein n=1 Tax=Xylophilus sp. GOD-11R TaxID=3089814 RepID=UPI00298D42FE|nr:hypothetical protein [Xylophilus sp. GOD-11R]WPB55829.1 hypothetical protein R9X41_16990 [Xylophilus sp. GOD-11R]